MVDGVESISEVDIGKIDIAMRGLGILQKMDKALEVARCVMFGAEALLGWTEDTVVFGVFGEDSANKAGPEFVNGVMHADGSFIGEHGRVVFFM